MAQPAHESHWNHHKDTLNRVRSRLSDGGRNSRPQRRGYEPLADSHPLLTGNNASRSPPPVQTPPRGRHSHTPPHLPRMETPPEHKHDSRLRGVRFDVLPNVQRSYRDTDEDSWGEEEDEEEGYPQYPMPYAYPGSKLPMPVVMYPMILPPQPAPRKSRDKGKKRVRVRNSPVYLNSRDNTLHEPQFIHDPHSRYLDDTYDGGGPDDPAFGYIRASQDNRHYDPFDPHLNPVLARYSLNGDRDRSPPSHKQHYRPLQSSEYFDKNPLFARKFTEELLNDLLHEDLSQLTDDVITDHNITNSKQQPRQSPLVRHSDPPEGFTTLGRDLALERYVEEFIDDAVHTSLREIVTSSLEDCVSDYLQGAAIYDVATDLVTEIIEEVDGPDIVAEAMFDFFLEDWLEESVIEPELKEMSHEVILDVCDTYNDKRRMRDIRQVKKDYGGKTLDSLFVDYLLLVLARQGRIWTETEYVNKRFDDLLLSLLLEQCEDVTARRRQHVNNKPVRRHHEKMVTDTAVDVLLEEIAPTLDEDMADLDEYEMGMQLANRQSKHTVDNALFGL